MFSIRHREAKACTELGSGFGFGYTTTSFVRLSWRHYHLARLLMTWVVLNQMPLARDEEGFAAGSFFLLVEGSADSEQRHASCPAPRNEQLIASGTIVEMRRWPMLVDPVSPPALGDRSWRRARNAQPVYSLSGTVVKTRAPKPRAPIHQTLLPCLNSMLNASCLS